MLNHPSATLTTQTKLGRLFHAPEKAGRSRTLTGVNRSTQGARANIQRLVQPTYRHVESGSYKFFKEIVEGVPALATTRDFKPLDSPLQENYPAAGIRKAPVVSQASVSPIEAIVIRIARLQPGWGGEQSVIPSENVQADLIKFASYLPANLTAPEVEVDPEDGSVTLIWERSPLREGTFAVVFTGSGFAIGASPSDSDFRPWRLPVSDEWSLIDHLEDERAIGTLLS